MLVLSVPIAVKWKWIISFYSWTCTF